VLCLFLQSGGVEGAQGHLVEVLLEPALGRDGLPQSPHEDLVAANHGVDRQARIDPAVDLASVGEQGRGIDRRRHRLHDRKCGNPARRQMGGDAAQACNPLIRAGKELHQLHRRQDQIELFVQVELAGVPELSAGQARDQLWIEIQTLHRVAAPRQVQQYAPGSTAEIEDRACGPRKLLPQRQIGPVGPALGVMPNHRRISGGWRGRGPCHLQNSCVSPREDRTLCSSSSAV